MVFDELDKWAYDIEKENMITPKIKKQYNKICETRDKTYSEHQKYIEELNKHSCNVGYNPRPKSCFERCKDKFGC